MLKAGVTGGIGSGKSVVCQVFRTLGIPVFNADEAARQLMENDTALVHGISRLLGNAAYKEGKLDRASVAAIVYHEPAKLQQLNALVHPATLAYAKKWIAAQDAPYIIKEAALFFETNSYKEMDVMLGVYAPEDMRISRAMGRSGLTRARVLAIMDEQMDDAEKMQRCGYVITNDDMTAILPQVLKIHALLLQQAK